MKHLIKYSLILAAVSFLTVALNYLSFTKLPLDKQLNMFPDDAFYYMAPAINISKGLGPTGDGVTLTSGYHPLWMAVLVLTAKIAPGMDRVMFFNTTLIIGSTLHFLTAMLIFFIALKYTGPLISLIWSSLYLFCEGCLIESLYGLESPLLAFLLALFILLEVTKSSSILKNSARGILLGLIFLARTDSIFFIAAWMLINFATEYYCKKTVLRLFREYIVILSGAFLAILPWFIFSFRWYGTIFQKSMVMKELWRSRISEGFSSADHIIFSLKILYEWLSTALNIYTLIPWLFIFLFGALFAAYSSGKRFEGNDNRSALPDTLIVCLVSLFAYSIIAGLFYSIKFNFVKSWYFVSARLFYPLLGIYLTYLCLKLLEGKTRKVITYVLVFVILVVSAKNVFKMNYTYNHVLPEIKRLGQFIVVIDWIKSNIPENAAIGAYSSGTLSYFSERRVINLDGLCNNDIYQVNLNKSMEKYIDDMKIKYLVDYESIVKPQKTAGLLIDAGEHFVASRLKELHRVPSQSDCGDVVAYKVLPKKGKSGF